MSAPGLVALDWGTSNLRACLLDAQGQALLTRSAPVGVMAVPNRLFEPALREICGDWLNTHDLPVVASGMIGSRQGWHEVAYLDCPARLEQAAQSMAVVEIAGRRRLHIVPGLRCLGAHGIVDVLRGEETQVWGAALAPRQCAVLPGTHSKWVWTGDDGRIEGFRTFMTGELYALHREHGILGRLMVCADQGEQPQAFAQGAALGLRAHALAHHVIFSARTAALNGDLAPEAVADYLSGLLIGLEVGQALHATPSPPSAPPLVLIGEDALCARYAAVLAMAQVQSQLAPAQATQRGQWRLAQAAGLVHAASLSAAQGSAA